MNAYTYLNELLAKNEVIEYKAENFIVSEMRKRCLVEINNINHYCDNGCNTKKKKAYPSVTNLLCFHYGDNGGNFVKCEFSRISIEDGEISIFAESEHDGQEIYYPTYSTKEILDIAYVLSDLFSAYDEKIINLK